MSKVPLYHPRPSMGAFQKSNFRSSRKLAHKLTDGSNNVPKSPNMSPGIPPRWAFVGGARPRAERPTLEKEKPWV